MNSTVIIGFGHKARRGKDLAVQTIIEQRGAKYDIRRYAFGDALKAEVAGRETEMCLQYGLPIEPENKYRTLLQFWGMERRKQDPFYWIKKVAKQIAIDNPQIALISDVRLLNEFMFVGQKGGHTVKIERIGYVDFNINPTHISETDLDNALFDYEIQVADGDVEELKKDAVYVFDLIVDSYNPPDTSDINDIPRIVLTDK